MASNKVQRFGPTLMVTGATGSNYISPAGAGTGAVGYTATASYVLIKHIRITNITASAVAFSLFIGGTTGSASGTAVVGNATPVPATGALDFYPTNLRLDGSTPEFLSGTAATVNALVLTAEGEVGLA
jgi:hypothetical protein